MSSRRKRKGKGKKLSEAIVQENVQNTEQFIRDIKLQGEAEVIQEAGKDGEAGIDESQAIDSSISNIAIYLNLSCLVITSKLTLGKVNYIRTSVGYEMVNGSNDLVVIIKDRKVRPREKVVVTYETLREFKKVTKRDKFGYYNIGVTSDGIYYLETTSEIKCKEILNGAVSQDGGASLISEYSKEESLKREVDKRLHSVLTRKWDDGFQD